MVRLECFDLVPLAVVTTFVCVDPIFLILYRELYYRHVYSRLQPDIDDRFHSYENSCELFNYILSAHASLLMTKLYRNYFCSASRL